LALRLAAEGKRFAVLLYQRERRPRAEATDSLTVLLNFFDELRRRVPVSK
jgi:hypothetical protein